MKNATILLVVLVVGGVLAYSYSAYKIRTETELAAQRQRVAERDEEVRQRAAATAEAQRLAAVQAEQAAAEAQKKLAEMRAEETAAAAERAAAEAEAERLKLALEDLRQQKESAVIDAQVSAEQRRQELLAIAAAERDALAKLDALESQNTQRATREAAHAAALARQAEVEKEAQARAERYRLRPQR